MAVGHAVGKAKCLPIGGEDQSVLELEVADEYIASLPQTHFVDTLKKTIVTLPKRTPSGQKI